MTQRLGRMHNRQAAYLAYPKKGNKVGDDISPEIGALLAKQYR